MNPTNTPKDLGIIMHVGPFDDVLQRRCYDEAIDADCAAALAQFLKRVTFSTCERLSTSAYEAEQMMDGLNALRRVLNAAGYDPR